MCEDRHLVNDKANPTRQSLITSPPVTTCKGPGRETDELRATSHQIVLVTNISKSGHPVGNGRTPMLPTDMSKGACPRLGTWKDLLTRGLSKLPRALAQTLDPTPPARTQLRVAPPRSRGSPA